MTAHLFPLRVYYEDTDFSGFVYHARYLHFMERARTEFLRECGVDQRRLFESHGGPCFFAVTSIEISFRRPARMDDIVTVETSVAEINAASLALTQAVKRDAATLAEAAVTVAYLADGKPRRLPITLRDALPRWRLTQPSG